MHDALERHAGAGIANFHALPIGSLAHAPDGETSAHAEQADGSTARGCCPPS